MIVGIPVFDVFLAVIRRFGRKQLDKSLGQNEKSKVFPRFGSSSSPFI